VERGRTSRSSGNVSPVKELGVEVPSWERQRASGGDRA
jgi:hypothetical protein